MQRPGSPVSEGTTEAQPLVQGRHVPGLDGLRGVAIAAVVVFHLNTSVLAGGYLGVDVFFVLSGFLITGLLLDEHGRTATVRLGTFYRRRARRLLPALGVTLVAASIAVIVAGHVAAARSLVDLGALRSDLVGAVLYVANWTMLAHPGPGPVAHLWSLSIEEQFYLVWPALLAWLLTRRRVGQRGLAIGLAIAAVASYLDLWITSSVAGNPAGAYLSTFARAGDLLVGALLATVLRSDPARRLILERHARRLAPGAIAVVVGFAMVPETPGFIRWPQPVMVDGGLALVALCTAAIVVDAVAVSPGPIGRALTWRPLVALGLVSYSLYLLHPIAFWILERTTTLSGAPLVLAELATSVGAATVLFVLVEQPLRRGVTTRGRRVAVTTIAVATLVASWAATTPSIAQPFAGPPAAAPVALVDGVVPGASDLVGAATFTRPFPARPTLEVRLLGDAAMVRLAGPLLALLDRPGVVHVVDASNAAGGLTESAGKTRPTLASIHAVALTLLGVHAQQAQLVVLADFDGDAAQLRRDPHAVEVMLNLLVGQLVGQAQGTDVVLVAQPPPTADAPRWVAAAAARYDRALVAVAAAYPSRVLVVGPAAVLHDGHPSTYLPPSDAPTAPEASWVRVRMTDGIGLCQPGAARAAFAIADVLRGVFGLDAPPSGWWRGSWTTRAAFDSPGRCIADHP